MIMMMNIRSHSRRVPTLELGPHRRWRELDCNCRGQSGSPPPPLSPNARLSHPGSGFSERPQTTWEARQRAKDSFAGGLLGGHALGAIVDDEAGPMELSPGRRGSWPQAPRLQRPMSVTAPRPQRRWSPKYMESLVLPSPSFSPISYNGLLRCRENEIHTSRGCVSYRLVLLSMCDPVDPLPF